MLPRTHFGQRRRRRGPQAPRAAPLPISKFAVSRGYKAAAQRAWLRKSAAWPDLPPAQWTSVRILGAGGHGICGLWRRILPAHNLAAAAGPTEVVVKQVPHPQGSLLEVESKLLRRMQLNSAGSGGSEHIVKLYKECFYDPGSGTNEDYDPNPNELLAPLNHFLDVARIYLEFCSGGDLSAKFETLPRDQYWSEEELWRLLRCLIMGAIVMDIGTEQPLPVTNQWTGAIAGRPIAHFDLKPENILIGAHDPVVGQSHHRLPPFKIADFGLALPFRQRMNAAQTALWIGQTEWRCTPGWLAPEQMTGHEERLIGPKGNVWGIGAIMHFIMRYKGDTSVMDALDGLIKGKRADQDPPPAPQLATKDRPYEYTFQTFVAEKGSITQIPKDTFESFGHGLLDLPYSRHLIELVHACLAYYPSERLTAQEVLPYVDNALATIDALNATANNIGPIQLGQNAANAVIGGLPRYTAADIATLDDDTNDYEARKVLDRPGFPTPPAPPRVAGPNMVFPSGPRRQALLRGPNRLGLANASGFRRGENRAWRVNWDPKHGMYRGGRVASNFKNRP